MCRIWFEPQHTVETSSGLNEAIGRLSLGAFDVIVVDLGLPDGDGADIVKKCRWRRFYANTGTLS
jgi:CheY-like chemotaxis protein